MQKNRLSIEEHLCAFLFIAILLLAMANIIGRYFIGYALAFTEEVVVMLFVWATMLGAPVACAKGINLGFTLFADKVPQRYQKYVVVAVEAFSILMFVALLYFGCLKVKNQIEFDVRSTMLHIPEWVSSIAIPLGSVVYIFRSGQKIVRTFKEAKV
jgi:TRAP-type C4-dicarboxylate transport system permease small subunit